MSFEYVGREGGGSGDPYKEEQIVYLYRSDDQTDTWIDLFNTPEAPRIRSRHPDVFWKWCIGHTWQRGEGAEVNKWQIIATYAPMPVATWKQGEPSPLTAPGVADPNGFPDDQLDDPEELDFSPKVQHSFEEYSAPVKSAFSPTEAATRAFGTQITGTYSIVYSNLEDVDPPAEAIQNNLIIDIQRNVDTGDAQIWGEIENLRNAINTDSLIYTDFKISIPKHCARLRYSTSPKIEYQKQDGNFSFYRALNVQLVVDWRTWNYRTPDIGSYAFSVAGTKTISDRIDTNDWAFPAGAEAQPFTDEDENLIRKHLDGKGNELTSGDPKHVEYTIYRKQAMRTFIHYLTDGEIV